MKKVSNFDLFLFRNYSILIFMKDYKEKLSGAGLKVTPQRISVLESFYEAPKHPTAEQIIATVRLRNPHIATGTIYNILETFVEKGIICRVKTDRDIMRYDSVPENHHHLYCSQTDSITDYYDQELNLILENYFKKKRIENFSIEDIRLQIIGKFSQIPSK